MEIEDRLHRLKTVTRFLWALGAAGMLAGPVAAADNDKLLDELRRQLAERDVEIAALKQQIAGTYPRLAADAKPTPVVDTGESDDGELTRALESSLARQGGRVLRPGTIEVEPEIAYAYDEPAGRRRDSFRVALNARAGLRNDMQIDLYVPYVVSDRWSGVSTSSGVGDLRLGITKEMRLEGPQTPAVLAFAQWRTKTGDINKNPPTGFGQDALQVGLSMVKRRDPIVLFGSIFYTAQLGSAHLSDGTRINAGNVFGGRLGSYLATTPDTSFYLGVAVNSNAADRINGDRIEPSSRLAGVLELAFTKVVGRGRFVNVSMGFGVTPAAPKLSIATSFPIRF